MHSAREQIVESDAFYFGLVRLLCDFDLHALTNDVTLFRC